MKSALAKLDAFASEVSPIHLPLIRSFRQMLEEHARVKAGSSYIPYHLKGRELLKQVIDLIDEILGSETGAPLKDSMLAICGGAQFGKTVLVLNLMAYLLGVRFMSAAYYLPDKDLIDAVVDGKLRPDVIEQIPWFAPLIQVGKTVNKLGKTVNRKGAMLCTDGKRTALGYVLALNKPATTVSADVVIVDERDDIKDKYAKYVGGRLAASDLRLEISIGTMRIHGAGQNKQLQDGTQHVGILTCPECGHKQNPEESFPQIIRFAEFGEGKESPGDPQLTYEGNFKRPGGGFEYAHSPDNHYYFGCTACGAKLDRRAISLEAKFPERAKLHLWSVRISQLGIGAMDLSQIVKRWNNAIRDPESMIVFRCDVLAMPANTSQALTPQVLERAHDGGVELTLGEAPAKVSRFGGLDMGDRCWFTARQAVSPTRKEMIWLEQIALGSVIARVPLLFHTLGLTALLIDSRPDANTSRMLCLILNGLVDFDFHGVPMQDPEKSFISFGNGLAWDGLNGRWHGLKAAVCEFTQTDGGLRQRLRVTDDGIMYPVIQANRDQTIQRAVNELLTSDEGIVDVIDGKLRTEPLLRTPALRPGSPAIIKTWEDHLIVGSQKVKDAKGMEHFIDQVENHLLLSDGYGALIEKVAEGTHEGSTGMGIKMTGKGRLGLGAHHFGNRTIGGML